MITPNKQIPTTRAKIVVYDETSPTSTFVSELIDTVGFTYSSDALILGDPFTVVVPNPNGKYTTKLLAGSKIELYLENPAVQASARTRKALGIIVKRRVHSSSAGTIITLECADLGWHLLNNDAPLYYKLYGNLDKLLTDTKWIDPSWGINTTKFRTSNIENLNLKLNNAKAGAALALSPKSFTKLNLIQVEPGDKIADIIITYARRLNLLVTMSCDGYLQLWSPNYSRTPLYRLDYHPVGNSLQSSNNVLDVSVDEDITSRYTDITCVGEYVNSEVNQVDPTSQNGNRFRGYLKVPDELNFVHRLTFSDGEIYSPDNAPKLSEWRYKRGKFDSFRVTARVRSHQQNGTWWEADTLCEFRSEVLGINENLYISAVTYTRDDQGDRTDITMHRPNLLQASFPRPLKTITKNQKNRRQLTVSQPQ